jgi:hypothetical protein
MSQMRERFADGHEGPDGGRTWWAHFEFIPINIRQLSSPKRWGFARAAHVDAKRRSTSPLAVLVLVEDNVRDESDTWSSLGWKGCCRINSRRAEGRYIARQSRDDEEQE